MGSKLIRGETIYFVRHGGPIYGGVEAEWLRDNATDALLLPRLFTDSQGHRPASPFPSVVPIEIRTFELSHE